MVLLCFACVLKGNTASRGEVLANSSPVDVARYTNQLVLIESLATRTRCRVPPHHVLKTVAKNMTRQPEKLHDSEVQMPRTMPGPCWTNTQVEKSWRCRLPTAIAVLLVCVGQRRCAGSDVFLRKANLSAEKQSQIVSAAMSRYEYEPLKDAMLTAIPQAGALRGCVPLHRKQSGVYSAQGVEAQYEEDEEEHVLETNEASNDELKAEHRESIALMTIAKQRRAEVDQARQFFQKKRIQGNQKYFEHQVSEGKTLIPKIR